ncbi:hypothetical protein BY458DRAFT_228430 [Sporodiniella umbellata]|nr:hypothetical protein BY458DRAFT_228430 [Sporodiniella umbellata]
MDNEEDLDFEDIDFQAPILSINNTTSKKRPIEEEEEELAVPEQLKCTLCEKVWTTQGAHRIVHLKCGDVFGKSCIDSYIRAFGSCPLCGKHAAKKDTRVIWPTKMIHEDESEMKQLKDALEKSKNDLLFYLEETTLVQSQLKECRNRLSIAKMNEEVHLSTVPSVKEPFCDNTASKKFVLHTKYATNSEKYRTLAVLPLYDMIVVSSEMLQNKTHGIRKINMLDYTTTEYIGLHLDQIKDIKVSSEKCMALSTGLDKTLKLTSLTNNITVQTYILDVPGWSCAFDENQTHLLYCGLANNILMVYDVRNTRSHLHKLKDPSSQASAPIHSLSVGKSDNGNSSIMCSNLVKSYEWHLKDNEPLYFPIETLSGFKPFHSYYKDGRLLSSLRNKDSTEYILSKLTTTSNRCFNTSIEWSYTHNKKQISLARNCFFERENDSFICFSDENMMRYRNKDTEIQSIALGGKVLDIQHYTLEDSNEIIVALCENEVNVYKYT